METLRVASFNIRNGRAFDGWRSWPFRRRATAAAIEALDADVVALQEAYRFQLRWLLRHLPLYESAGVGRSRRGGGEHSPVLWDPSKAELVDQRTRWYGPEPDRPGARLAGARFPRVATLARLRLGSEGKQIQVVSTHLDSSLEANRHASAAQLVEWLDLGAPVIVLGDLNATPGSSVLEVLRGAGLRDALGGVDGGTEHSFTGRTDRQRIDHILVTDHWEVASASIAHDRPGGRLPSDHWPVVADLRLVP